jgi:hypothetical protein
MQFHLLGKAISFGKVKEIIRDAKVRRVVIKDEKCKVLLSIPVTWGATGAVVTSALAPWLAALGLSLEYLLTVQ